MLFSLAVELPTHRLRSDVRAIIFTVHTMHIEGHVCILDKKKITILENRK